MVGYLSHTLSAGPGDPLSRQGDNIASALRWWRSFTETTKWAVVMPWLEAIASGIPEIMRPIVFANQVHVMARCDALILVGPKVTAHMLEECDWASHYGLLVVDLTDLGGDPPDNLSEILRGRVPPNALRLTQI